MKRNRWFASVLLTTLLAMSGAAYAHDGDGGKDGRDKAWHHGDCHKVQFSDAQKQLLHETMKKTFEKDKALFQKMHELHKQLHAVIAAPTFDSKAFESISASLQETRDQIHKDRMQAFASIAAQFTPEEREMIMRWHKHHHGHHDGEEHHGDHAAWHDGQAGHDGQGWHHDHEWQQQQPTDNSAVTFSPTTGNRDYPPYNK